MNRVFQGDCLETLAGLPDGSVDLVYADPPYGTGRDFGQFDDRWQGLDDYLVYMRPRLAAARRVLTETGSLYLHCDTTASAYLRVECDHIFGRGGFLNEIVWGYRTGGVATRWWPRKHDTILWYAKSGRHTFHPLKERVEYERPFFTDQPWADVYVRDVWDDIEPVINVSGERNGYPTQKPVALLERIIRASSNEGGLVADPFCGSGTALVAAKRLGRRWWGCDLNPQAVALAESRLAVETAPLAGLAGG